MRTFVNTKYHSCILFGNRMLEKHKGGIEVYTLKLKCYFIHWLNFEGRTYPFIILGEEFGYSRFMSCQELLRQQKNIRHELC